MLDCQVPSCVTWSKMMYIFVSINTPSAWMTRDTIFQRNFSFKLRGQSHWQSKKKMVLLAKRNLGLHDFFHDFLRTWLIDSLIFKIQMSVIKWVPCFPMILRDWYTQHYPVTWRMTFHVDNCGTGFFSPTRQLGLFVTRGKPLKWHHGCQIWEWDLKTPKSVHPSQVAKTLGEGGVKLSHQQLVNVTVIVWWIYYLYNPVHTHTKDYKSACA